jgi:branched-chain amino acid transport system permease protein
MYMTLGFFTFLGIVPIFSLPLTAILFFGLGIVTYRLLITPVLNAPMVAQIVITFGLLLFMRNMGLVAFTANFRMLPAEATSAGGLFSGLINVLGVYIPKTKLVAFVLSIIFIVLVDQFFKRTRTGMALRATAQDRKASELVGINVDRMFKLSWGLGIMCVGIGGVLLSTFHYIYPEVGLIFTLFSFVIVTLGGFGSIWGSFLGGLIIGLCDVVGGVVFGPPYKFAVAFIIFVAVLFWRPQGLFGGGQA